MFKSSVCIMAIAAACMCLSSCAGAPEEGRHAHEHLHDPAVAAFLEQQGFELGLNGDQAKLQYHLTALVDAYSHTVANPDITSRPAEPESALPMIPTEVGFFDGAIRNDSLIALQKCISIEPGIIPAKQAIEKFLAAYGLAQSEHGHSHRRQNQSTDEFVSNLEYHGAPVRFVFRPCYDNGRTLSVVTLSYTD